MFLRGRRLVQDRKAGLVFDWRKGHGSFTRLVMAVALSSLFCGVLFSYVRIERPEEMPLLEQGKPVTMMNLALPENQWLADLIERESPFDGKWEVRNDLRLEEEMEQALGMVTPARYVPKLIEASFVEEISPLKSLPGEERLPLPEPVSWPKVARQPAQWWIEFESPGHDWSDYAMPWEQQEKISAGESWGFLVGLDPSGAVVSCIELEGRGEETTARLSEALQRAPFPENRRAKKIRWWKILAIAVNRNAEVEGSGP